MTYRPKLFILGALFLALALSTASRADTIYTTLGGGSSYVFAPGWEVSEDESIAMPFTVPAGPGYSLTRIEIALTWESGTNLLLSTS